MKSQLGLAVVRSLDVKLQTSLAHAASIDFWLHFPVLQILCEDSCGDLSEWESVTHEGLVVEFPLSACASGQAMVGNVC